MTLRLIEMVVPSSEAEEIQQLLAELPLLEMKQIGFGEAEVLVRILLESEIKRSRTGYFGEAVRR